MYHVKSKKTWKSSVGLVVCFCALLVSLLCCFSYVFLMFFLCCSCVVLCCVPVSLLSQC